MMASSGIICRYFTWEGSFLTVSGYSIASTAYIPFCYPVEGRNRTDIGFSRAKKRKREATRGLAKVPNSPVPSKILLGSLSLLP